MIAVRREMIALALVLLSGLNDRSTVMPPEYPAEVQERLPSAPASRAIEPVLGLLPLALTLRATRVPAGEIPRRNGRAPIDTTARTMSPTRREPTPLPLETPRPPRRVVNSTAYCEQGRMASGKWVYDGAAAMNGIPFGTRFEILTGPLAGKIVVVEDRFGHSTEFDVWMESCAEAIQYGRRRIEIQRAPA